MGTSVTSRAAKFDLFTASIVVTGKVEGFLRSGWEKINAAFG
jgi:hypothetical protein